MTHLGPQQGPREPFHAVDLDWTHSSLPGDTKEGGIAAPLKWLVPSFSLKDAEGGLSIKVVTSDLDSHLSRMLRAPTESSVVGEV